MSSTSEEDRQSAPDAPRPTERAPWTRRFAPLLLVAGAVLAGGVLVDRLPKERHVELRLEDAATVRQLDVIWSEPAARQHGGDVTPVHGSTWRFAEGTAPKSVQTTVRLPDGPYDLQIEIDSTRGRATSRRTITLGDADRITLPVR